MEYCSETARLYVSHYPWFYMPQSVHRILVHIRGTIEALGDITLGEASEEAQESRNKDHLYAREHHSRKKSRKATNEDQMNFMMVTSDPVISSLRKPLTTHKDPLSPEVIQLLIAAQPSISQDGEDLADSMETQEHTEESQDTDTEDEDTDEDEMEEVRKVLCNDD